MSPDALAPIAVIAHYNLLERIDAAGPGDEEARLDLADWLGERLPWLLDPGAFRW